MEVKEHFYRDDPSRGHPDVKTTLPGVNYYFLGNGLIQAAVQVCSSPPGTPVGLLIMDPERFGSKRDALSFNGRSGLAKTILSVKSGDKVYSPGRKDTFARWTEEKGVPCVVVEWPAGPLSVRECFYCPDRKTALLLRRIEVSNRSEVPQRAAISSGMRSFSLKLNLLPAGGQTSTAFIEYRLLGSGGRREVRLGFVPSGGLRKSVAAYWENAAVCDISDPVLGRLFQRARFQLQAHVAKSGRMDGSFWQYNLEWVRDQAFVAMALAFLGRFEQAKTILRRLLARFVSAEGAPFDSSRLRADEECEFDQNGVLLMAIESYVLWSGDFSFVEANWPKIAKTADFPLKPVFRHPGSGLLQNRREFWERHSAHGIEDGMELAHQVFVSLGLMSASRLARMLGKNREAGRWYKAAVSLKQATLHHPLYSLVERGRFIKRRKTSGEVQNVVAPPLGAGLPVQAPLFEKGGHFLNPDTSVALPIAWEFIDPHCPLALRTLRSLESLWNQRWTGGGYGRYNTSSEPDSPGPWPFASLFIARACFEAGMDMKLRRVLNWLDRAPGSQAGSWFEFFGPRLSPPYPQVGIIPWTWAEICFLVIHHILGVRPAAEALHLRPRLPSWLGQMRASLRLRGTRLNVELRKQEKGEETGFLIEKKRTKFQKKGIFLPWNEMKSDLKIEAILPCE